MLKDFFSDIHNIRLNWIKITNILFLLIEDKKIFLKTEITLQELAKELGTNRSYISNII